MKRASTAGGQAEHGAPQDAAANVGALCRRDVVTIDAQASLQQAARRMRDEHVGALVVTATQGDEWRLIGVVTDRDLALHALAEGTDPQTPVARLTKGNLVAVPHTASVSQAIAVMREAGVRRLLLLDADRQLVGIVSLDDLLHACANDLHRLAESLQRGMTAEAALSAANAAQRRIVRVPEDLAAVWRRVVQP